VEAAPAQTIESGRNIGFDDAVIVPKHRPRRDIARRNYRITQNGHAALLQCSPLQTPQEWERCD
jgi:hypothetical protein